MLQQGCNTPPTHEKEIEIWGEDKHDHTRKTNEHYHEHKKGWGCAQKNAINMIMNIRKDDNRDHEHK